MSKIALITDTHFGVRNDKPEFHDMYKKFLDNVFFPTLEKEGIEHIIHLGDLVDRRKFVNFYTEYRMTHDFINPIVDHGYQLHVIIGNHDTFYRDRNSLNAVRELYGHLDRDSRIRIWEKPSEVQMAGRNFVFMPWICDETYEESMNILKSSTATTLFGHLDINGFEMHKGHYQTNGYDRMLFDNFPHVFSGHFHHASAQGNITYLAAAAEYIWSDYDDARGFYIFDTDTDRVKFIQNPYRMFRKVFYDDTNRQLDDVLYSDFEEYKGTYTKVIVVNKTNPYWFDMFIDKLESVGLIDLTTVDDHKNANVVSDDVILEKMSDTMTIFKTNIASIKDQTLNKPMLENIVSELYVEAQFEE